jgi:3-deoxy-D-manno-octulosonic acid (KDO) 8-phosphate synthase
VDHILHKLQMRPDVGPSKLECVSIMTLACLVGRQGGGVASGGLRDLIPTIARTAVAVGIDGIFMEVRIQPPESVS